MWDRVEVALQIGVDNPCVAFLEQLFHSAECVFAAPSRTKAVALLREISLEDRLQHELCRRLNHPVAYRRDSQGSRLLRPRFGNVVTPDLLGTIIPTPQ